MELTTADLKPLLPGLQAVLDDEAVSEAMVNPRRRPSLSAPPGGAPRP